MAMERQVCITAALICLLGSLVGCSALAERTGLRVRLDKVPVTAVSASLINKRDSSHVSALGPGQSAPLVITAVTQDGKQLATVGAGRGKVAFDNYKIEATVVQVSKSGIVSLPSDPRLSDGQTAHLRIVPSAHPDIVADLYIPARYDIPFAANFSGSDGFNGTDGLPGLDGSSGFDGTPGIPDPMSGAVGTPGPGGNGSDGGNGGDGSDGQDGAPGGDVSVWIHLQAGERPLLQVKVAGGGRQLLYLVDPNGGSLKITTNGGSGGRGGTGGRGGRGGRGGNGSPSGFDGHDGLPGRDGHPGRDGAAGTIAMSVDPAAEPFLSCISWSNHNGGVGSGSPPKINVGPVAALW
jgi:hypothetical protein